jgi:hypothetical protein
MVPMTEVVGWILVAFGALLAHLLGIALGFIVAAVVGAFVLFAWFGAMARYEKDALLCECIGCHHRHAYGKCIPAQLPWRKRNEG